MLVSKKKQEIDIPHRVLVKDKEIENAKQQIENYKKEIQNDQLPQVEDIFDCEKRVKENALIISDLKKQIYDIEKMTKDKGKELEKLTDGEAYSYQISNLINEVRMWREKIRTRQETYDRANGTTQMQADRLVVLEKDNEALMQKIKSLNVNVDSSQPKSKAAECKSQMTELSKDKKAAKDLLEQKQAENRKAVLKEKKDIAELKAKRDQLMTKLKEQDQEKRISTYKLREVKRDLKHNQLKPLAPLKHLDSKASSRSDTEGLKKSVGKRGSAANLMTVTNSSAKPLESQKNIKTLSKDHNTQSSQILIKKKKMYTNHNKEEEGDEEFEKNQVIEYEKFQKMQDKKDSKLGQIKSKGSKGTFETKVSLK